MSVAARLARLPDVVDVATGPVDAPRRRLAAALTSLVLAAAVTLALVAPGVPALLLLAWQLAVFAVGAFAGPAASPHAVAAALVLPSRADPEDPQALRSAQALGLALTAVAFVGYAGGLRWVGTAAAGVLLLAAALDAGLGTCLGCSAHRLWMRPGVQRHLDAVSAAAFH